MGVTLFKQDLRAAIKEALPFDFNRHTKDSNGKLFLIINTIFNTITKALKNGERVTIEGLGSFYVIQEKPQKRPFNERDPVRNTFIFTGVREYVPKKRVKFVPAVRLKKEVRKLAGGDA